MAVCVFDIPFTGSATALFERARAGLLAQGGTLTGDATRGSVDVPTPVGRMKGTYAVTGQVAHFEILEKPFLVSCARIHSELAKLAAQPPQAAAPATSRAKRARPVKRPAKSKMSPRGGRAARGRKKVAAKKKPAARKKVGAKKK